MVRNTYLRNTVPTLEIKSYLDDFKEKINAAINDFNPMINYPAFAPGKSNTAIPIGSLYGLKK